MPIPPFITKYRLLPQQVDCWLWPRKVKSLSRQPVLQWQISGDTNELVPLHGEQQLLPPGQPSPKMPLLCPKPFLNTHVTSPQQCQCSQGRNSPFHLCSDAITPAYTHVHHLHHTPSTENSDAQHVPAAKLRLRQKELHRREQTNTRTRHQTHRPGYVLQRWHTLGGSHSSTSQSWKHVRTEQD